jgi:hypothetical protein
VRLPCFAEDRLGQFADLLRSATLLGPRGFFNLGVRNARIIESSELFLHRILRSDPISRFQLAQLYALPIVNMGAPRRGFT